MSFYNTGHSITCCYQCPNRHPCCHSSCEKYIKEKAEYDAKVSELKKQKNIQQGLNEYKYDGMHQVTKHRIYRSKYRRGH